MVEAPRRVTRLYNRVTPAVNFAATQVLFVRTPAGRLAAARLSGGFWDGIIQEKYVWTSIRATIRPLPDWMLGFRPEYQPLDHVGFLQGTLAKAAEWGQPVVILAMDIAAAFDNLQPGHVARRLRERGASAAQVAAVLRHIVGARVQPRATDAEGPWTTIHKGIRQGVARNPDAWNDALAGPLEAARAELEARLGPSIQWNPELARWGVLVYADDVFVASASWQDSHERAKASEEALRKHDLSFSADSLEAMGNAHAGPAPDLRLEACPF